MKIENTPTKVHTNVSAPAIALGIDMAGMNHVMSILSNLYSDPYLAVLREYSTNARDSHVATLNRRPIEITSPTDELPQLVVTDHGLGLGCDELIRYILTLRIIHEARQQRSGRSLRYRFQVGVHHLDAVHGDRGEERPQDHRVIQHQRGPDADPPDPGRDGHHGAEWAAVLESEGP